MANPIEFNSASCLISYIFNHFYFYLLFSIFLVELGQSLVSEVLKLGVSMLQLGGDHLLEHFVSLKDFIFLMALVPLCGSTDGSHSKIKVRNIDKSLTFESIH